YWCDDGDLLLVVQDHVFKLKHTALDCSEVFRDMFAFAHSSADEELGGCAVVHLTDAPRDWMLLLQCMDDPHKFWETDDVTYDTLASALRLATKYEIPVVREPAVARLQALWPPATQLETMDTRAFSPHRFDAITLARQCDLPEILPAIFYSLAV
ncbi:hypothetical protein BC834DRAFT_811002, partial [Gloeopeniophorella convolvens]